jgi:hypothetical protein
MRSCAPAITGTINASPPIIDPIFFMLASPSLAAARATSGPVPRAPTRWLRAEAAAHHGTDVDPPNGSMRSIIAAWIFALAFLPASAVSGQVACPLAADSTARPHVRIHAHARIGELRFMQQPIASASVAGCGFAEPIVVTIRENLPRPVEPGVTYRDVDVAIEIRTNVVVLCSPALQSLLRGQGAGAAASRLAALCPATSPDTTRMRLP